MTKYGAPSALEWWRPGPADFEQPLDVIRKVHERQAEVCDRLDELIGHLTVGPIAEEARGLLDFLTEELPRHVGDEEEDLFRLLEARCPPEDGLPVLLDQLSREHELDEDLVDFLVEDLRTLVSGHRLSNPVRLLNNVRAFTETQRRHLAWEDATVLPLAERRLTADDFDYLSRRMARRWGVAEPR